MSPNLYAGKSTKDSVSLSSPAPATERHWCFKVACTNYFESCGRYFCVCRSTSAYLLFRVQLIHQHFRSQLRKCVYVRAEATSSSARTYLNIYIFGYRRYFLACARILENLCTYTLLSLPQQPFNLHGLGARIFRSPCKVRTVLS